MRYEDLALHPTQAIRKLKDFIPQLGNLDPHASSLSGISTEGTSGGRGKGIAEYFAGKPMVWQSKELVPEVWSILHSLNYSGEKLDSL